MDKKWKIGDILIKGANERKIIAEYKGKYATTLPNSDELSNWYTQEEFERLDYILKESKWKPYNSEEYFYPCLNKNKGIHKSIWRDGEDDNTLYEKGLVCKTEEEAKELHDKILKSIN